MSDTQKHLLIVDDEKALREAIAERLADHGFVVEQAPSGEQALERLADFAFDVIITDLRLPGIDGRRVLDAALEYICKHKKVWKATGSEIARHYLAQSNSGESARKNKARKK